MRSLARIKAAWRKINRELRGSDEEYARVTDDEARALEPYRTRANETETDMRPEKPDHR